MPLQSTFSIKLPNKVLTKTVCCGRFDGQTTSIAMATTGGRVIIYSLEGQTIGVRNDTTTASSFFKIDPNSGSALLPSGITMLHVNQEITCLATGRLRPESSRDVLLVGTQQSLLAYDIYDNADLFHKDIPEGVNCLTIGPLGPSVPLLLAGGNCCLAGYDAEGQDSFWTVTGDNVTALALVDVEKNGRNELVVGSEDFELRVYNKDETILRETTETSAIIHLLPIGGNRFAYALDNGTLGAYEGMKRIWRIKSKNVVSTLLLYSCSNQEDPLQLVTGWSNGKLDFRKVDTGEVLHKESLSSAIAGAVSTQTATDPNAVLDPTALRADGAEDPTIVVVTTDGEIRGFAPSAKGLETTGRPGESLMDPQQELLHELHMQRAALELELANYRQSLGTARRSSQIGYESEGEEAKPPGSSGGRDKVGIIPANTQLQTALYVQAGDENSPPSVELHVQTSNETVVRAVIVFAEGVFPGESHIIHPPSDQVSQSLRVQMRPQRDIAVDLHIKALVGMKNALLYHVFELSRSIPVFAMFALCEKNTPLPESYVTFAFPESPQRLAVWASTHFLLSEELELEADGSFDIRFLSLRGSGVVGIKMSGQDNTLTIHTETMDLAGEIVHSLAEEFGIATLESTCDYPAQIDEAERLLNTSNDMYATRERLTAEMAGQTSAIKTRLIRAEEAKMLGDYGRMKQCYTALATLNEELIAKHAIRTRHHEELLATLKSINLIIQAAGKLRVGQPKTKVIQGCRNAIKDSDYALLGKIIRLG